MLTPSDFYMRMLFGVFVEQNIDMALRPTADPSITWHRWGGMRIGHAIEDGYICVLLDLGDRVIGARRTRFKSVKWIGKKPRIGDQVKMALVLPEKYA